MSGFDVTSVGLLAAGGQVREVADEVQAQLAALAAVMDALCDGAWRGPAAAGFAHGWGEWRAGAAQLLDGLAAMGALLTSTGHDYAAAETASAHCMPTVA